MTTTICSNHPQNISACKGNTISAPLNCVRDEPCGPCVTLTDWEAKVLETETLLEDLKRHRNIARSEANHLHDPLIHQVPPEIASYIFILHVGGHRDGTGQLPRPLVLASVCSKWREIAFSTPQLWTSLRIRRMGEQWKFPVQLAEQWLARSGQLPLDIVLQWQNAPEDPMLWGSWRTLRSMTLVAGRNVANPMKPLIRLICAHSGRWKNLVLHIPCDAFLFFKADVEVHSTLESLIIDHSTTISYREPPFKPVNIILRPKKVYLGGSEPADVHIDWKNVVDLKTPALTLVKILKTLQQCPRITKLQVSIIESHEPPIPTPLILPCLKFLRIQSDSEGSDLFFNLITAPKLCHTVDYHRRYPGQADLIPLTSLLKRSGCSLARLKLECSQSASLNEERLISLLFDLPTLVSLSLHSSTKEPLFSNDGPFIRQFLADSSSSSGSDTTGSDSRQFLPHLKTFTYKVSEGFSWSTIADIYRTHSRRPCTVRLDQTSGQSHSPRSLTSLHIATPDPMGDEDLIDKASLLRLFDLPENSMAVTLNPKLMKASIKHHHLTPDKAVSSFYNLSSPPSRIVAPERRLH